MQQPTNALALLMVLGGIVLLCSLCAYRPGVGLALALLLGRQSVTIGVDVPLALFPLLIGGTALSLRANPTSQVPIPIVIPLFSFAGAALLRAALGSAEGGAAGVDTATHLLLVVIPMTILASAIGMTKADQRDFTIATLAIALVLTATALAMSDGSRVGALGGGPITLAQTLALAVVLLQSDYGDAKSQLPAITIRPIIAFLSFGVVWTESRGPTISLVVALGVYVSIGLFQKVSVIAMSTFLSGAYMTLIFLDKLGLVPRRFDRLADAGAELARSRGVVWGPGLEAISLSPLHGCGLRCFHSLNGYRFDYPHNLLIEAHIVGGVALVVITVYALWTTLRKVALSAPNYLPIMIVPIVASLFSGDWFNNRAIWVVGAMLMSQRLSSANVNSGGVQNSKDDTIAAPIAGRHSFTL